jgi:hypothetical protein
MAWFGFVVSQIREIEEALQKRLEQQHETGRNAMVRLLARIVGVGVEAAEHPVLCDPSNRWPMVGSVSWALGHSKTWSFKTNGQTLRSAWSR